LGSSAVAIAPIPDDSQKENPRTVKPRNVEGRINGNGRSDEVAFIVRLHNGEGIPISKMALNGLNCKFFSQKMGDRLGEDVYKVLRTLD
jgi:hypothetical protein